MNYFVYIVSCKDDSLYTGYTTDIDRRIKEHNTDKKGAKYTKAKRPVTLKYSENFPNLSEALKRENQIKKLSREEKVLLIGNKTYAYGIQGGKGSFNEQAILHYLERNGSSNFNIRYLHTTDRVLKQVDAGKIDFGLFAIHNSTGGMVQESIFGMAKYKFSIVQEFAIKITHHLMCKKEISFNNINTIVAHPQVIKQCKNNLLKKYPNLETKSGEGNLIDTANAAKALYENKLPDTTAILGPENLANRYNYKIIESNLQDLDNNLTSFLLVKK